ncbi:YCF48-related protein [Fluviicola taffensis]|uniref:T9SS type A sorting domain-containing protein n=1 Tax=Fluviicola taffensis TaxID=191579 RepID=UPI003137D7DD
MKFTLTIATFFIGLFSIAQTFSPQNSGVTSQLNGISFATPSKGMVVGNSGVIRKTSDAGLTWTASNSGTSVDLTAVAFLSSSIYIAVGKTGKIIKTTNAGTSWSTVNSGTTNDLTGIFVYGVNVYVTGSNGTILISTNSGNAWTATNTGISFKLNKIFFVSEFVGYAVGDGATILKTVNGGQVWNFQSSGMNTPSLTDVYFTDANTGVITGSIGGSDESIIFRTTNGGSVWTTDDYSGTTLNSLGFFPDNSTGFAVGGSIAGNTSTIYKTTSQGAGWVLVPTTSSRQLGTCFPANGLGYTCGLDGTILRLATNTAGIEESIDDWSIQISPNPSNGVFTVSSELNTKFSIEVFSVNGERIASIENGNTIDLSACTKGVYFAEIKSGSLTAMRKLVKE